MIYLVTSGSYSDYGVNAVFSTKEKAQEYIDVLEAMGDKDGYSIEEYELDPVAQDFPEIRADMKIYNVQMLRDATVREVFEVQAYARYYTLQKGQIGYLYPHKDRVSGLVKYVFANDKKHAVKIVNEIRTQMIANGEWD